MHIALSWVKAGLWLVMVCQTLGVEVETSPATAIVPDTTLFISDKEISDHEGGSVEEDVDSEPLSPVTVDSNHFATGTPRQEITNSENITTIRVICPSDFSHPSSLEKTSSLNSSKNDDLLLVTNVHNRTAFDSENGDYDGDISGDYSLDVSSPRILTGLLAKVDLGALDLVRNEEVEVEYKDCQRVTADIEVPEWVERLSVATIEGSVLLQHGWAKGGSNLKKLWLRVPKGLILDSSDLHDTETEGMTLDAQDLCSVLPHELEMLDASHTPLEVLQLDLSCSSKLTHLEASHSSLTKIDLCAPSLITLHLSWNSLEGSLDWVSCRSGLAAVEYLQVNQNSLSVISTCGWLSLKTLDLRRNSLTSLDLSTCSSANLTSVTASHNQLVTPPILPSALLHLDLNHNKLESLPTITHTLMTADFSHNSIIEIEKSIFKRARKLLHLSLAYNHITHIKEHDLNGLRELRTLDLSHNRLREIAGTSLMSLRHLRKLYLHHNHLNTLDVRDLAALTPRAYATLYHNPWHCVCQLLASLQRLQHCPDCQHQVIPVECRERGSRVAAAPFLRTCLKAVQEVTQRLDDESDEDFSEEDNDNDGISSHNQGAVVAVPVLLILIISGAIVAMSYRLYHRHKRAITARLNPYLRRCGLCHLCGCSPAAMSNGDLNHHRHGELSQMEQDSDTETEL